jgi:hypothetical protein
VAVSRQYPHPLNVSNTLLLLPDPLILKVLTKLFPRGLRKAGTRYLDKNSWDAELALHAIVRSSRHADPLPVHARQGQAVHPSTTQLKNEVHLERIVGQSSTTSPIISLS